MLPAQKNARGFTPSRVFPHIGEARLVGSLAEGDGFMENDREARGLGKAE